MTDDDLDKLAEKLAAKLQTAVTENIYKDAGRNLIGGIKKGLWALVIALAAWGFARVGTDHGG